MDTLPKVSCICLTYGRPRLLEEAIHSFLQQDYPGEKELIVLNDYQGQVLSFAHPHVQVINVPVRFRTVGEKMNAAVALASHDLLFVWDDDDIYLPHRLSFSVRHFDPGQGFFKSSLAWTWQEGRILDAAENLFHVASCWSRGRFDAVRGYPADGTGYDLVFEQRLDHASPGCTAAREVAPEEIYYIYRWGGTGSYHMSAFGDYEPGGNVGNAKVEEYVRTQAERGQIQLGRIVLAPCWRSDYSELVADHIRRSRREVRAGN